MKKFINRILGTSKKAKFLVAAAATTLLTGAVALAGWGPSRPVYDWNNEADRKGSLNGPVFNSFINTPVYGDERAFIDGRDNATPERGNFRDQLPVEPGKEYVIRMYVHNNANETTNDDPNKGPGVFDGPGVAKDTKVRFNLLPGIANGHGIGGYISASNDVDKNGNPVNGEIWDTVDLRNEQTAFAVEYVPGSAMIQNDKFPNGKPLSDDIVKGGVLIGDQEMNGNVPGCFEFASYVTIRVKVTTPELTVKKSIRKDINDDWKEVVEGKVGETVQWLIEVKNTGSTVQHDVITNDLLPPHLEYVEGSAKWYSASQNGVAYDFDQLEISDGDGGYNFGNYAANGGSFLVRFDTKLKGDFDECTVRLRNIARARSDENPTDQTDSADVIITREDCDVEEPSFRCDLLKAELVKDRTFKFTVDATAENGATVKQYRFNFGDGTDELVTDQNVVNHTFPEEGSFAIKATVDFTVDGETKSHTSEDCETVIDTEKPPVTPPELPKTGAGDIVGIFVATTLAGAVAHKFVWARRFNS